MNNKVNKLLHEFFYDCHQRLWNAIIKYIKNHPYCDDIEFVKWVVARKIFGNIIICGSCFGCHLTLPGKSHYINTRDCKRCFLGLSEICSNWDLLFHQQNSLINSIKTCEKIRDCGYIYTKNKKVYNLMVDLFIKMVKDL